MTYPPDFETKTHYVYEFYTEDGTCLYVGCSAQVGTRIQQHVAKPWWLEVARIEVNKYSDFHAGRQAEKEQIEHLSPVHNKLPVDPGGWITRRANMAARHARNELCRWTPCVHCDNVRRERELNERLTQTT